MHFNKKNRIVAAIILLVLLSFMVSSAYALDCSSLKQLRYSGSKSYDITKAFIDISIQPDGSVVFDENITYDFYSGKFSFAYVDIPIPQTDISDITVQENDQPACFDIAQGSLSTRITWYYDEPDNNKRTFQIRYTLRNVVKTYDDYSEFYWKVWGDEWTVDAKDIEGRIHLPKGVDDPLKIYLGTS